MYKQPECPYSYISLPLEFNLRVLFPCEYPQYNILGKIFFFKNYAENEAGKLRILEWSWDLIIFLDKQA